MRSIISNYYATNFQKNYYNKINDLGTRNASLGRFFSASFAVVDVVTDILRHVANTVEQIAMTVINLFGAPFSEHCSLNDGLFSLEIAFSSAFRIPISLVTAPIKWVNQIARGLWDPTRVRSSNPLVPARNAYVTYINPLVYGCDNDKILMRA